MAALARGSHWTNIDHRLPRHATDQIISKKHGSAFFGTDLAARYGDVVSIDEARSYLQSTA